MALPASKNLPRRVLSRLLRTVLPAHVSKELRSFHALAKSYGQLDSMKKWSCVDAHGNAIPWYTYPAIEYLKHIDFTGKKVFEYGSGNSSLWWAARCGRLISVESDGQWYERIQSIAAGLHNFDYRLATEKQAYVRHADLDGADVIIIDGLHRPDCADFVLSRLAAGGVEPDILVFDNADWYPATIKRLKILLAGWVEVDFSGFGPINDYTWTTTIFLNSRRAAGLSYLAPPSSAAGLVQTAIDDR